MRTTLVAALCTPLVAAPAWALDLTLDFSGNICGPDSNAACGDFAAIGQGYGDTPGLLDVAHRALHASTLTTAVDHLWFWSTDFSDLTGVAFAGLDTTDYIGELRFTPAPGYTVTLHGMTFGNWLAGYGPSSVQVLDAGTQSTLWDGGAFNPGLTAQLFQPQVSSASGLLLRWGPDAHNIGIDNITLSVSPVPEPGTWMMAAAGLLGLGAWRRWLAARG